MATFTVTTTTDGGAGSLRQAVMAANATAGLDVIDFDASVFDGEASDIIRLTRGQIDITDALVITAGPAGVTITGDAAGDDVTDAAGITDVLGSGAERLDDNSRIFDVSGRVTLDGLTLTGGRTIADFESGGALRAFANLVLTNCTLSGNSTAGLSASGGGVAILGYNSLLIERCTVSGNSVGDARGGGIFGGYADPILVSDSTIANNSSSSGGGIAGHQVVVRGSTITANTSVRGGGISAYSCTAINATISGNSATEAGGGIWGGGFALTSSTVSGNAAATGGGLASYYSASLTNCIVLGNAASIAGNEDSDVSDLFLMRGNILGSDVFSGASDIADTSVRQVFAATFKLPNGILAGKLAENGGPTQTIALKFDISNPALGGAGREEELDQRGVFRDAAPDLGAFEAGPVAGLVLVGGERPEVLAGADLADQIYGGGGNDHLTGNDGDDQLRGGAGSDLLRGGRGDDGLDGGAGWDVLKGGPGDDRLYGGDRADRLRGGAGDDRLAGGKGADRYLFAAEFGSDVIVRFDANPKGGQDRIDLRAMAISAADFEDRVRIEDLGDRMLVTVLGQGEVLLRNVSGEGADSLDQSDFLL